MGKRVEFLLASEDFTWGTEIIEVPENIWKKGKSLNENEYKTQEWANTELMGNSKYRKVVQIAIYNLCPDSEEEVPTIMSLKDA